MSNTTVKALYHCVYALQYHLVIVTKYRKRCLTAVMLADFEKQAAERCRAWGGSLLACNGEADHVHVLIELPPTAAPADFVNALKTGTSRRLRNVYTDHLQPFLSNPVLWSRSYCILSCGGAPLDIMRQYIAHRNRPDD